MKSSKLSFLYIVKITFILILKISSYKSSKISNNSNENITENYQYNKTSSNLAVNNDFTITNQNNKTINESNLYDTFTYEKMMADLIYLNSNYTDLIELKNNVDYDIDFPEGSCGKNKCHIVVARLTNKNITNENNNKSKLLLNCGYNGIDNISPVVCFEFIKTILESFYTNDWIKFVLNSNEIYIIPILNPFGFYIMNKEEFNPMNSNKEYLNNIDLNFSDENDKNLDNDINNIGKIKSSNGVASKLIKKLLALNNFKHVVSLNIFDKDLITFPWRSLEKSNLYDIMINNKKISDKIIKLWSENNFIDTKNVSISNSTNISNNTILSDFEDIEIIDEEEIFEFDGKVESKKKLLIDLFDDIPINPYYTFPTQHDNIFNRISQIISKISGNNYVKKFSSSQKFTSSVIHGKKSLFFPPNKGDMDDWIYKNHNTTLPFSIYINVEDLKERKNLGYKSSFCIFNSFNNPFYYVYNNKPSKLLNCLHNVDEKRNAVSEEIINDLFKNNKAEDKNIKTDDTNDKVLNDNGLNGIIPNYIRSLLLFTDMMKEYIVINSIIRDNLFFKIEFSLGGFISKPYCLLEYDFLKDINEKYEVYKLSNIDKFSKYNIKEISSDFNFRNSLVIQDVKYIWDTRNIYMNRNIISVDYSLQNSPEKDNNNKVFIFELLCGYKSNFKQDSTSLIFYYK